MRREYVATRLATAAVAVVVAACGSTPPVTTAGYLDQVAAITVKMTNDSVATLPQGKAPTHLLVAAIIGLRSTALDEIENLEPTDETRPEHTALVTTLGSLVDAGNAFLDQTAALDQAAFVEALTTSTDIDALADDVHAACVAMERLATALGHPVTMGC